MRPQVFPAQRPYRRDVVEEPEGEVITGWQTQTLVVTTGWAPTFGGKTMGLIDSAFHPDRKRQENWQRFSREVGGAYISEGPLGGDEILIPFMGHRITVRTQTQGRGRCTVMSAQYSSDGPQFKIFGWGGRKVPEVDRDPYLNSEFPDLASRTSP